MGDGDAGVGNGGRREGCGWKGGWTVKMGDGCGHLVRVGNGVGCGSPWLKPWALCPVPIRDRPGVLRLDSAWEGRGLTRVEERG